MFSRFFISALAVFVLVAALPVNSAEFSVVRGGRTFFGLGISIRGEIKRGDFDRFRLFLLEDDALKGYASHVWLNSPGGDVIEAMRFADLLDKSGATAYVGPDSKCYSACVFIFAGAASRSIFPQGELGVHRITLKSDEVAYAREKSVVVQASEEAYAYLVRQGIPQEVVTKMRETPASELFVFDFFEARRFRSLDNPAFVDIVEKRCGKMPADGKLSPAEAALDGDRIEILRKWVVCRSQLQTLNLKKYFQIELTNLLQRGNSSVYPTDSAARAKRAFDGAFAE